MKLTIIDCGAGNLHSVASGFRRAASGLDVEIRVTTDPADLDAADRIVLPGVGAFADCMGGLNALPGMMEKLEQRVRRDKVPFLGICVGMQMLLERSHEHGVREGLGWIEGEVVALKPQDAALRVPHMGWNTLTPRIKNHPLFDGIAAGDHVYFVHSFHAMCKRPEDVLAVTDYGGDVVAALGRGNILGMQFHPEKSQKVGEKLLRNFLVIGDR